MPVRRLLYYGVQEHAPAQYGWCCHGQRRKDNPIDLALGVPFGWVAHWGPAQTNNKTCRCGCTHAVVSSREWPGDNTHVLPPTGRNSLAPGAYCVPEVCMRIRIPCHVTTALHTFR